MFFGVEDQLKTGLHLSLANYIKGDQVYASNIMIVDGVKIKVNLQKLPNTLKTTRISGKDVDEFLGDLGGLINIVFCTFMITV